MNLRLMCIGWPAFLAACLLELVVFAFVDPNSLELGDRPLGWSRQGVYTAAFFVFWAVNILACWLSTLLRMPASEVNRPFPRLS